MVRTWACSSVGRATALQAEGQEFDSPQVHKNNEPDAKALGNYIFVGHERGRRSEPVYKRAKRGLSARRGREFL